MSTIIDFFVAPDDAAAAGVLHGGPEGTFETASCGNFDVFLALGEWTAIFAGSGGGSAATTADSPDVVAGGDAAPWVLAVPPGLARAVADADRPALAAATERWVHDQAADGTELDAEVFTYILDDLAGLARTAAGSGGAVYCWVC